ncbi:hypothetical protein DPMN_034597 [Dreissena polymorpha]|uniref:Uncharacterized protein n=1 Tax=Dreissena polymorpha TaxID=45954 RepID=A0A9D4RM51_DREPO|nr:hypothetical protein DPMN_034597 [Dreissena polymorpha]
MRHDTRLVFATDSAMFTKFVIMLQRSNGGIPVIIDASDFGDVLALVKAGYRQGVEYPSYINNYKTLPFHVPFRALTNQRFSNLLVAGKTVSDVHGQLCDENAPDRVQYRRGCWYGSCNGQ